ncbi:hypothetical protein FACS1894219_11490 [Clostridia bacterium]|nr:hypothetical protein FACS1894219_11490 [Clostridia bacterium]
MAKYSLNTISANCYPNTTVLINKFGITNDKTLSHAEADITQQRILLWNSKPLSEKFDFKHYKSIHKFLFEELYEWAGQIRDVDISKKGTKFCPHNEIENRADLIFTRLQKLNYYKDLPRKNFINEFVDFYISTNDLHPFREGNGRTQRLFLAQLSRNAGYNLDFANVDTDELMIATIQSAQGLRDCLLQIFNAELQRIKPYKQSVRNDKTSISDELEHAKLEVNEYNSGHTIKVKSKRKERGE